MSFFRHPILALKRADSGLLHHVKSLIRNILSFSMPVPKWLKPLFGFAYALHYAILEFFRQFISSMYRVPLFKGRCHSVGKRLRVGLMPYVTGNAVITLGDDVHISGKLSIAAGRVYDSARFAVGNKVFIGHEVSIMVSEEIIIEDNVSISARCVFADNDGHPIDPQLRAQGMPPFAKDVRPIRICRNAWIGRGSYILKGVTIGEGAIVGAGSVVTHSIPAFSIASGNPARVVKNIKREADVAGCEC